MVGGGSEITCLIIAGFRIFVLLLWVGFG